MNKTYTFSDFQKIIETLRSENGCPWDREQTHESLKPCMIEEAAEVAASIRIYEKTGNDKNLCEELGDVLLQVMLHSQIATEEGRFSVEDVIQGVSQKMIRRHPHVFGEESAKTAEDVVKSWEEIKKIEKSTQDWVTTELRDIPIELPALMRAQKVQKKIDKQRQSQNEASSSKIKQGFEKMRSIVPKLEGINNREETKLIGELLYECANLAKDLGIDAEEALIEHIDERILRFETGEHEKPRK